MSAPHGMRGLMPLPPPSRCSSLGLAVRRPHTSHCHVFGNAGERLGGWVGLFEAFSAWIRLTWIPPPQ